MALGVDPAAYESQEVFDELLATVTSKPDARELFQHLIAAIGRIVPYDEAQLVVLTDDGSPYLYVGTPDGGSEGVAGKSAATNLECLEPQVLDTVPEPDRDLRCALKVPVKVCDRSHRDVRLVLSGAKAVFAVRLGGRAEGCQLPRTRARLSATRRAGPSCSGRATARSRNRRLRRTAPNHLGRTRHPHGVSPRLGNCQQDAAARRVGDGVHGSRPSFRASGQVAQ